MEKKVEQISIIEQDLLTYKEVNAQTIINAGRLAEEDNYLYDLMVDWAKEIDGEAKTMMREEIVNYTEEIIRKMERKNDRY